MGKATRRAVISVCALGVLGLPYGDQAVLSASPSLLPVLPPRRVGARNKATGGAWLVSLESDKRFLAQADIAGGLGAGASDDDMVNDADADDFRGLD